MWIKTPSGITNLSDVKHIGIVGEGDGTTVRFFFKIGMDGPHVDLPFVTHDEAQQALKNIQKALAENVIEC